MLQSEGDFTVLTLNIWFDLKLRDARTRALLEARDLQERDHECNGRCM